MIAEIRAKVRVTGALYRIFIVLLQQGIFYARGGILTILMADSMVKLIPGN
jgi:hypothetical protein